MLDIGFQEIVVLMVIALLVFGPDKLPELGRRLGRAMREFRRASDEFRTTIETNLAITEDVPLPPSASKLSVLPAADPVTPAAGDTPAAAAPGDGTIERPLEPAAPADEAAAAELAPTEPFAARRGGRLLHRAACAWVRRIAEADRLPLKMASEGWGMGLLACPVCDPRDEEPVS
jgi:TatA/E family protein of Tat protein translocase